VPKKQVWGQRNGHSNSKGRVYIKSLGGATITTGERGGRVRCCGFGGGLKIAKAPALEEPIVSEGPEKSAGVSGDESKAKWLV